MAENEIFELVTSFMWRCGDVATLSVRENYNITGLTRAQSCEFDSCGCANNFNSLSNLSLQSQVQKGRELALSRDVYIYE